MSGAISPGQRCVVKVDGRRLPGYIRSIGDTSALVRLDTGEVVEAPIMSLGREDKHADAAGA